MNIPEKVKVCSMIYNVVQSDKTLTCDGKTCKGTVTYDTHLIEINNAVQDSQGVEQTFLHELVHAIVRERNISLSGDDEELKVEEIARGLHTVIVDNPGIFNG